MVIKSQVTIDRPVEAVWEYITQKQNWIKWMGSDLNEVDPGWEKGATLVWEQGRGTITDLVPNKVIEINSFIIDNMFRFTSIADVKTVVEYEMGASFTDGGRSQNAKNQAALDKLKLAIEGTTIGSMTTPPSDPRLASVSSTVKWSNITAVKDDLIIIECFNCHKSNRISASSFSNKSYEKREGLTKTGQAIEAINYKYNLIKACAVFVLFYYLGGMLTVLREVPIFHELNLLQISLIYAFCSFGVFGISDMIFTRIPIFRFKCSECQTDLLIASNGKKMALPVLPDKK